MQAGQEEGKERFRLFCRVFRGNNGGNQGDAMGAGVNHLAGVPAGDAAEGKNRNPEPGRHLSQAVNSHRRAVSGLGRGMENRAVGDEVRPLFLGGNGALPAVAGDADQLLFTKELSGPVGWGCCRDAQLDTVGIHGQGDIDAVVDEESGAVACGELAHLLGKLIQFPAGKILFPQLNRLYSSLERLFHDQRRGRARRMPARLVIR